MSPLRSNNNATVAERPSSAPRRPAPGARLAIALMAIAAIWLLILPAVAQVAPVREMIRRHEADGIDPSAKFYSELPAMPEIIQQVEEARRQHPAAF